MVSAEALAQGGWEASGMPEPGGPAADLDMRWLEGKVLGGLRASLGGRLRWVGM